MSNKSAITIKFIIRKPQTSYATVVYRLHVKNSLRKQYEKYVCNVYGMRYMNIYYTGKLISLLEFYFHCRCKNLACLFEDTKVFAIYRRVLCI